MRERKYRAWNNNWKRWALEAEISELFVNPESNGTYFYIHDDSNSGHDNITIEAYTGLKDKNDKEIYEGDIVKQGYVVQANLTYDMAGIEGEDIGIVKILPSQGACISFNRNKNYKNIRTYRSEIIGNIHQDPALLEKGK